MRERGKSYSERTSVLDTDIPLRRYFLVYEGTETEPIYFDAVEKTNEKSELHHLLHWYRLCVVIVKAVIIPNGL